MTDDNKTKQKRNPRKQRVKADVHAFLILELETGLYDGWYLSGWAHRERIRQGWDVARAQYTHVVVVLDRRNSGEKNKLTLPENRLMPTADREDKPPFEVK